MGFEFIKSQALIDASRAAARRARSEYVHCLLIRAMSWLAQLPKWLAGSAAQPKPCC